MACLGTCPALEARPATITLLHVNDTHSHLDAWGPKDRHLEGTIGGMAKAASVIAAVRASEPNVLLLHAGDVFHGDLFCTEYFGVPELQLMQQLGFDAMAVGNHEFDLGPDVLAAAYRGGTRPLLSANLDLSEYPALATWIKPNTIKEVGGVSVGIFGMTVPDDVMNMPAPTRCAPRPAPTPRSPPTASSRKGSSWYQTRNNVVSPGRRRDDAHAPRSSATWPTRS